MRHILITFTLLAPTAAVAHTGIGGHGAPFVLGLAHPLIGADHLLAMVAVGLFAAMTGGRARIAYPASFVLAMILGGTLGYGGVKLPVVEPTILASVILLGAAIAAATRPALALASAVIAVFGLAHGYAHAIEAPALAGLPYAAGFLIATAALHGLGLAIGFAAGRAEKPAVTRALGGLTALAGAALAMA